MVHNVNKKLVSRCQLSKRSPISTISIQSLPYIVHILPWTIFEINFLLERMKLSLRIFQRTFKIVMRSLMFKFNNFPRAVVSQYRSKPYIVYILPGTIFEINFLLERMKLSLQIFQRTFKIVMRSLMFKFNNFPMAVVSQYRSKVCLTLFISFHGLFLRSTFY